MARRGGGGAFGPIIIVAFLMVFFAVVIIFANVIFAENEASLDMVNMTNETLDDYNSSVVAVQAGLGVFTAVSWFLVGAAIFIAVFVLYKYSF